MMYSLFATLNPGIEMLVNETLLADAFPSKAPAVPPVIGLFVINHVTIVQPVLAFGFKEVMALEAIL